MKKKIYLSGAISSDAGYKIKFIKKARELEKDYTVLTPLFINAELTWKEYMRIDLSMLSICDAIYMLKDWRESRGAKIEHEFALMNNIEVIYQLDEVEVEKTCWNCGNRYLSGSDNPCNKCDGGNFWGYKNYED